MLVVLEGCDGSGKTTLANKLAKILNAEVIHCSTLTPNNYEFFKGIIDASKERNIIADRFCYGQFVYQNPHEMPLAKPHSTAQIWTTAMDMDTALRRLYMLESDMLAYGAKIVYVTAPVLEIKERLELRNEVLINGKTVEEVQAGFKAIFGMSVMPVIEWNTGRTEL